MKDFDSAYNDICVLVEDFKKNEIKNRSKGMDELKARNDYINKFFIALGWDVLHDTQKDPYEQEVDVEWGIDAGRVDYAFSLEPNYDKAKFLVEAKKPFVNLENPDFYFQAIQYGYSASTPFTALTNFENFFILDSRFSVEITGIKQRRKQAYHYTEYTDKEKFSNIYFLFSKEGVTKGNLEKYALQLGTPRHPGIQTTLFKVGTKPIDDELLDVIEDARKMLAKAFKRSDDSLDSHELTEAAQRTIDRIIFFRFLEDKLIEPKGIVTSFAAKGWNNFVSESSRFNIKYNGVVFKEHKIDSMILEEREDYDFKRICAELCHEKSRYNFNYIRIDVLGSIYERFLGNVVVLKGQTVSVDKKPEVKKAGGVYYTPQYIVDYIVENTIQKLIERKSPKQISQMKFADISCGSGSFLIGVFKILIKYYTKYYNKNIDQAKKDGCILDENKIWRIPLKIKERILVNNIFGVDIDHQAVEVTMLSLYLKLLEEETVSSVYQTRLETHDTILPPMNKNVICGNSLVETDVFKLDISEKEGLKFNAINIKEKFKNVFPDGFDAIVGNPPYVRTHKLEETLKIYLWKKYETFVAKSDLYSVFMERGLKLLKNNGLFSYIVPKTWTSLESFEKIRILFLHNSSINTLTQLPKKVFRTATVETCIFNIKRSDNKENNLKTKILVEKIDENMNIQKIREFVQGEIEKEHLHNFQLYKSDLSTSILSKFKKTCLPLSEYVDFVYGFKTGDDDMFLSQSKDSDEYEPFIRSADIQRYCYTEPKEYVWYNPEKMISHRKTARPGERERFEKEKILVSRMGKEIIAAYDSGGLYVKDAMLLIRKNKTNMLCLVGILNSKLITYCYKEFFITIDVLKNALLSLPIPKKISKLTENHISNLVSKMISTQKDLENVKTERNKIYLESKSESYDKEINEAVFELYGLDEKEKEIIENSAS